MTRQAIIDQTLRILNRLPEDKAQEISDFAAFVASRYEDYLLSKGVQQLSKESKALDFLAEEEDLYTEADLKERYNGQGRLGAYHLSPT